MSKSKKTKWVDDFFEDDYDDNRRRIKQREDRRKLKKMKNAIKTLNIDELTDD
jgi:hypothetical protein